MVAAGDPVKAVDITALAIASTLTPMVRLIQQTAQSIAASNTALTFGAGSEDIDTNGWHDVTTNPSRITPNIAGYYWVSGTYVTQATGTPFMALTPGKTGAAVMPRAQTYHATTSAIKSISTSAILTADGVSDYFEMFALTNGGPTLSQVTGGFASVFECIFLRPL